MIPDSSVIYLDKLERGIPRKVVVGELSGKTQLYGYPLSGGFDSYMYIEKFITLKQVCLTCTIKNVDEIEDIQYIISDPETKIGSLTKKSFQKIYEVPFVSLWKRI